MPDSSNITSVLEGKSERLVFYPITNITERGEAEGGKRVAGEREGQWERGGLGGRGQFLSWRG
jgi:hypothetical protein